MIKDHHMVLDRAVDKLQTHLDELKVRGLGRPGRAAGRREDSSAGQSLSPDVSQTPRRRAARDTVLVFYCA